MNRNAVHIHHAGRTVVGWWFTDDSGKLVTVESDFGRMTTQIGSSPPENLAALMLHELAHEGLIQ